MTILEIDYDYYMLPEGMESLAEFIGFLNAPHDAFIKLTRFETANCVAPYFVEEDVKTVYLNTAVIPSVNEIEGTVLSRAEYDARLAEVVKSKCVGCTSYYVDGGDNLEGHRGCLSLDGDCYAFTPKTGDSEER